MALPTFLANKFSPLDFSSIASYPNHVPSFHEWNASLPRFSGNIDKRSDQQLMDFHECMEQQGIIFEDAKMKLFMSSLEEDFRVWYKKISRGSISSLNIFHITFNHYCKRLYPRGALFEDCCEHFNVENIFEVNDPVEDVCGTTFQEDIYSHQEASPSDQERE